MKSAIFQFDTRSLPI